jgi:predicted Zn-dependent protease
MITQNPSRRAFFGLAAAAAVHGAEPKVSVPSYNTLTDAEEIALGRKFAAQLEKEMPILQIGALDNYVNGIVTELGRKSRRPNLRYVAKVVNTTDVNAVSMAGGHIFVFRGLLEAARNEAELVGVLAHEVGHVVGRHSANQMMLNFRARQVYEIVRKNIELQNKVIEQIIEKFGGAAVMLAMLRYDREQEFEADLFGFYNMIRAGWDSEGMISFFRRSNLAAKESNWLEDALSTHPNPAERARRVQAEAATLRMPAGLSQDSVSFRAMKVGLRLLPAPVRPKTRQ